MTNLDLLASGRELVDDYVSHLPESHALRVAGVVERGKQASARIQARYGFGPGGASYAQNSGSGVFVSGGDGTLFVLTAGHTFEGTAADLQVELISTAGRAITGTLLESHFGEHDYAVMRCERGGPDELVAATTAEVRKGDLVIALGYPDQCGVNGDGAIVRGDAYLADPLEPLVLLLEVASTTPLLLLPVAGALPLNGFSGGGLFDLDGHVIGVLTGVEMEAGKGSMDVRVTGCSVAAMRGMP